MALEAGIKEQLQQYLQLLEGEVVIKVSAGTDATSLEMVELLQEVSSMASLIRIETATLPRTPSFQVGERITFAGIPLGHEFTSFVLALLQVSGRKPKIDDKVVDQIKDVRGHFQFVTYISLSCHNCPDVVQALNTMSILNPNISHTMVDGAVFKEEVESQNIMAVPAVLLNGEMFASGRQSIEEILAKMGSQADVSDINGKEFDVLVIGGGPAGASAAIYATRKGIKTGLVAERFGGQVMDTMGIENLIGTPYTEGPKLVANFEEHVKHYPVEIMNLQRAKSLRRNELIEVDLESGATVKSKTVIIATGARWKNLGIPGEAEFKNKGVAYCPHCDGPLFKGKHVAVVGGGNSGVEAAIDLAGIVGHVTLLEFMPDLKADDVLQKRLHSLANVTVLKNVQTKEITGDTKVNGMSYIERDTGLEKHIALEGVFIQIGLVPNTDWLADNVERTRFGEIVVDGHNQTNVPGVFAAGDCTNTPYKQIVISIGSGATAALGAFDYLIRH
ncbi:alkyl hydroperoxide reductase subunit F [Ferrovum sp. PN-J185]|uniref:alkyl hydroperoxide reductase subunit F n=1 Tax=Ferrovum sp. PN-J185 TaxID=1356306 RepID=UPI00079C758B|nr:alkyl hydroperoxide reductase subunit F [Ferrovum sp. PN-J185]KXW56249.1 NADH dehydrogenase [Ferrovum sp. PN-J185]MCC6068972.1 alkyl hydroperoxide reductase subunit F [Ferrovum sp. PN-J185]MDE1891048.1 alkyl hydroperoxide reductase subunit F [Betaproteobacteria bacterium]MDE2055640.1 alkyl hydroperoxide reductase subunit F [Betaproteobacteria bacterium]